jgi:predicted dehydrogenase
MTINKKFSVGIAGLGFGREFIPIYQRHPYAGEIAICTRNSATLREVGDQFGIKDHLRYTDFFRMLENDSLDAIHIVTPIAEHFPQTIAALESGKHVACTVPMATTIEECEKIIELSERKNKWYMMMETSLFTREYLYVKERLERQEFGRVQFMRSDHMQNLALDGWGEYWAGFPPFNYGTHALSPVLEIIGHQPKSVVCHGSGHISDEMAKKYNSPFAVETATFTFCGSDIVAESSRCLFETIRQCRECFDLYGTKMSFEWEQVIDDGHIIFTGIDDATKIECPDTGRLLPKEIAAYTERDTISDKSQASFRQGIGHGGSHPHLVHQFLMALEEGRQPSVGARKSATITCAGLCAHISASNGAKAIQIPDFGAYR